MREVYLDWCLKNTQTIIGGEGKTVEIDEAKIGHRKYNRGRLLKGQWVFGGIERERWQIFLVAVKIGRRKI